jgi:hypothetical protein
MRCPEAIGEGEMLRATTQLDQMTTMWRENAKRMFEIIWHLPSRRPEYTLADV